MQKKKNGRNLCIHAILSAKRKRGYFFYRSVCTFIIDYVLSIFPINVDNFENKKKLL